MYNTTSLTRRARANCCAALLLLLSAGSAHAYFDALAPWADKLNINLNAEFSADRTTQVDDQYFTGKVHRAPQKTLMGMNYQGMQAQMLMREDLGKFYVIMPQMGMYREVPRTEAMEQQMRASQMESIERIGRDTVSGVDVTVFQVRFRDEDGVGNGKMSVSDSGVLVKMEVTHSAPGEAPTTVTDVLSNIVEARQNPDIFELSSDLQPFNPGAMLGIGAALQGLKGADGAAGSQGAGQQPSADEVQAQIQQALEQMQRALEAQK